MSRFGHDSESQKSGKLLRRYSAWQSGLASKFGRIWLEKPFQTEFGDSSVSPDDKSLYNKFNVRLPPDSGIMKGLPMANFNVYSAITQPPPQPQGKFSKAAAQAQQEQNDVRMDAWKQATDMQNAAKSEVETLQKNKQPVPFTKAMEAAGSYGMFGLIGEARIKMPGNQVYEVQKGDTLTSIARNSLGGRATEAQVAKFANKIAKLNADLIPQPDLIHPHDAIAVPVKGAGKADKVINFLDLE